MAISQLVQYHMFRPNRGAAANNDTDASATYYFPYLHPTLSGNLLVVRLVFPYSAGRTISVTDDVGNTYTQAKKQDDTSNLFSVAYYASPNCTPGAKKVTVVFDTAIYGVAVSLSELSGMALSSPVDSSAGTATATDPNVATGSFTPSTNNTIVMQTCVMTNANTSYGINKLSGIAATGGFSLIGASRETCIADQWKVHPSGSVNPTFSMTITVASPGQPWLTAAVAFKTNANAGTPRPLIGVRIIKAVHTVTCDAGFAGTTDAFEFPAQGSFVAVVTCFTNGQASFNAASDTGGGTWTIPPHNAQQGQIAYSFNRKEDNARRVTVSLDNAYGMNIVLLDVQGITAGSNPVVGSPTESAHIQTIAHQTITPLPTKTVAAIGNLLIASFNTGHGPIQSLTSPSGAVLLNSHYVRHTDTSACDDSGDAYGFCIAQAVGAQDFTWHDDVPDLTVTSITRSGSTAFVTVQAGNDRKIMELWSDGDTVTIAGAVETPYNGAFTINGLDAINGTFQYPVTGTPATPATGTITATQTTSSQAVVWEFNALSPPNDSDTPGPCPISLRM